MGVLWEWLCQLFTNCNKWWRISCMRTSVIRKTISTAKGCIFHLSMLTFPHTPTVQLSSDISIFFFKFPAFPFRFFSCANWTYKPHFSLSVFVPLCPCMLIWWILTFSIGLETPEGYALDIINMMHIKIQLDHTIMYRKESLCFRSVHVWKM